MHIPDTPLKFIAGLLAQPQAGSRQQIDPALQVKANAQPASAGRRPAAETLDQAVRALRDEGRLPRRGSLLDISV